MRLKILPMLLSILLSFISICLAGRDQASVSNPFDYLEFLTREPELIDFLGEGHTVVNSSGGHIFEKRHIYFCPANNSWVDISFSHVLDENMERFVTGVTVTKKKLSSKKKRVKKPFPPIKTSRGIKLGDTIEKVLKEYGKPSINISIENSNDFSLSRERYNFRQGTILRYLPQTNDMRLFYEFYFDDGKLHTMLFSVQ